GSPAMFETHAINLLDVFSPGEEILIRFRLFSDANQTGWGWALDNLSIQEDAVSVEQLEPVPNIFSLSQNYPNPFNPTTQINYTLPRTSKVSLKIFNVLGQEIRHLVKNEQQTAMAYSIEWDGKDELGLAVSSGVYFYKLQAGGVTEIKKMILMR
ncbi:MAG: T9SS type A sorting domain-containing protein, partial [bacterium]